MARIIFKSEDEFISYMEKFSGKERVMLLDVEDDNALILRPIVTSRIDTAIIYDLGTKEKELVKSRFTGKKFKVQSFLEEEERGKR